MAVPSYSPLESEQALRFLNLLPGKADDEICFELVHDTLAKELLTTYEATSYTWGSPIPTRTVRCDGRPVEMRQNAVDFLHSLRRPDEARMLWMDCICIDQSNLEERAEQVKMMHLIYRHAESVLVWLGRESEDSALAMEFASRLHSNKYLDEHGWPNGRPKSFLFDSLAESPENKQLVRAIAAILCRPWLRRVWIQQEAAMNKDTQVFCGQHEINWDSLFSLVYLASPPPSRFFRQWPEWTGEDLSTEMLNAIEAVAQIEKSRLTIHRRQDPYLLQQHASTKHTEYEDRMDNSWVFCDPENAQTLVEQHFVSEWARHGPNTGKANMFTQLVLSCSSCESTDPRDKIFALFNLTTLNREELTERPDIEYNVPWQIVYIRVAKWSYKWGPKNTLPMAGRDQQQGSILPSWVPDWRQPLWPPLYPHLSWFAGGGSIEPHLRFLSLPRSSQDGDRLPCYSYIDGKGKKKRLPAEGLELQIIMQDRICYSSPKTFTGSKRIRDNVPYLRQRLDSDLQYIGKHLPRYFTGESSTQAYAATLIMSTTHDEKLSSREYERDGLTEYRNWLENDISDPDPFYADAVNNAGSFFGNSVCVTVHGLIANVPNIAETGDYIAILSGFRHPVVLRKVGPKDRRYYELLGACYVHRMMRGRPWALIEEFKCKYKPGSEDEVLNEESLVADPTVNTRLGELCDVFPFNPKSDYLKIIRVLGTRRIVLV